MERDEWAERYLSVVPERLTADDARTLLGLMEQDLPRFKAALLEFIENSEDDLLADGEAE